MQIQNTKYKIQNSIIILIILFLFFIPSFVYANLVPCGGLNQPPCQFCHLFVMLDGIIDFVLLYIVFPVASLLIIFSGGTLMFSSGDPGKIDQGKKILFSTIIGLIIIFSAWLIVNEFMRAIGVANWTGIGDGWWTIYCPI